MKASDVPTKFQIPFGNSAGGSFIRVVPIASQIGIQDGAASFETGFPPDCFVPTGAGGIPPFGADVNGILNIISAWSRWFASGAPVKWDSAFSALIGGYPRGAFVESTTTLGLFWLCLVDDNATNPDTGGANWKAFSFSTSVNGQCYFLILTTTLAQLKPKGGATVVLKGVPRQIAPLTLDTTNCYINGVAAQATVANTTYNVYLLDVAGSLVLDCWTGANSGHMTDTTAGNVGVEVRSISGTPDSTRSLIGKISMSSTNIFFAQGYSGISWFNRVPVPVVSIGQGSGATNTAQPSIVELSAAARLPFLTWGDDAIAVQMSGFCINQVPQGNAKSSYLCVGFDTGVVPNQDGVGSIFADTPNAVYSISARWNGTLAEGAHYATPFVAIQVSENFTATYGQIKTFMSVNG